MLSRSINITNTWQNANTHTQKGYIDPNVSIYEWILLHGMLCYSIIKKIHFGCNKFDTCKCRNGLYSKHTQPHIHSLSYINLQVIMLPAMDLNVYNYGRVLSCKAYKRKSRDDAYGISSDDIQVNLLLVASF